MKDWWLYLLAAIMIAAAGILARKNQKETGVSFWRSFFYSVLLIAGIMALIIAALSGARQ